MVGKPRRHPVTDQQIVASYERTHSAYKTAAELGIGSTTVERVLRKQSVPRPGLTEWRQKATKFVGLEEQIRAEYERGATYEQLRAVFGEASDYAFKHALKRAGTELRENPAKLLQPGELERIRELNGAGLGQVAISLQMGRSQSFISRVMRAHGISTNERRGHEHSMWKGGRFKLNGYIAVWAAANDQYAVMRNGQGYILEHRLVMARKLGRPLTRHETVHHINGDKMDNRPENLELRQGKHGKHIVMCCLDCGSRSVGPVPIGD
jgi:hypothetical protein